jgi:hypothetical protein
MANPELNLRALTISQLLAICNTELPTATSRRQLHTVRESYGLRVSNKDGTIDSERFLQTVMQKWEEKFTADPIDWNLHRARQRNVARAEARSIGEIPAVTDPELRAACDQSLQQFLVTCFPDTFSLKFSQAHLNLIGSIERVIETGGSHAFACERGFGKTQISIGACIWSTLTGRVSYAMIVGANAVMRCGDSQAGERSGAGPTPGSRSGIPADCHRTRGRDPAGHSGL